MNGILIKKALDTLSDADKASDKEVLDMTREIVNAMFRGEVGAKLAINIANGVRLQHISEYNDSIQQARANPLRNLPLPLPLPPRGQVLWVIMQS